MDFVGCLKIERITSRSGLSVGLKVFGDSLFNVYRNLKSFVRIF